MNTAALNFGTGGVLGMYSLAGITDSAEGVTIDGNGVIYIVDEGPNMHALAPVPLPAAGWLLLSGVAGGMIRRRKINNPTAEKAPAPADFWQRPEQSDVLPISDA